MCTFTGFLVAFCEFVVFFRVCSWNSKVFQLASRLFQLNFLDFQGFSVGLCDFRRFFSLLVGPLQVFQLDGGFPYVTEARANPLFSSQVQSTCLCALSYFSPSTKYMYFPFLSNFNVQSTSTSILI